MYTQITNKALLGQGVYSYRVYGLCTAVGSSITQQPSSMLMRGDYFDTIPVSRSPDRYVGHASGVTGARLICSDRMFDARQSQPTPNTTAAQSLAQKISERSLSKASSNNGLVIPAAKATRTPCELTAEGGVHSLFDVFWWCC